MRHLTSRWTAIIIGGALAMSGLSACGGDDDDGDGGGGKSQRT